MTCTIPGVLTYVGATAPALPLVFDSPHSGRAFPADFATVAPMDALMTSWDGFVDELYAHVPAVGGTLLAALFPRAYIDANRAVDDIDPALLDAPWPGRLAPGAKSAQGMGLIRRFALPGVPLYDRLLSVAEVQNRIERYYAPYQATLRQALDGLYERFGCLYFVDCHSMKSVGNAMNDDAGEPRPDIVVSDRDHSTADIAFTRFAADTLGELGYAVSINAPYKGAALIGAYADPPRRRHAIQIELNRALYMDEARFEKHDGFGRLQENLARFVERLAAWIRQREGLQAAPAAGCAGHTPEGAAP
jgi:N-formylglutamate deformylase